MDATAMAEQIEDGDLRSQPPSDHPWRLLLRFALRASDLQLAAQIRSLCSRSGSGSLPRPFPHLSSSLQIIPWLKSSVAAEAFNSIAIGKRQRRRRFGGSGGGGCGGGLWLLLSSISLLLPSSRIIDVGGAGGVHHPLRPDLDGYCLPDSYEFLLLSAAAATVTPFPPQEPRRM